MSGPSAPGSPVSLITRRDALERGSLSALAAIVAAAVPFASAPPAARGALLPSLPASPDATLQAFADTILPGRRPPRRPTSAT